MVRHVYVFHIAHIKTHGKIMENNPKWCKTALCYRSRTKYGFCSKICSNNNNNNNNNNNVNKKRRILLNWWIKMLVVMPFLFVSRCAYTTIVTLNKSFYNCIGEGVDTSFFNLIVSQSLQLVY